MYKDLEKQKEANKEANRRYRVSRKGITEEGITEGKGEGITLLERPNGAPYNPDELLSDGSKRYMGPFFDGQVLDRTTVATPGGYVLKPGQFYHFKKNN